MLLEYPALQVFYKASYMRVRLCITAALRASLCEEFALPSRPSDGFEICVTHFVVRVLRFLQRCVLRPSCIWNLGAWCGPSASMEGTEAHITCPPSVLEAEHVHGGSEPIWHSFVPAE